MTEVTNTELARDRRNPVAGQFVLYLDARLSTRLGAHSRLTPGALQLRFFKMSR
jgi:hypothetical protein